MRPDAVRLVALDADTVRLWGQERSSALHKRLGLPDMDLQDRPQRDSLLELPDRRLLACCRVDRFRGTGRGGQKRNTTESAVRLVLSGSDITSTCDATRSQARNVAIALRKLRAEIALRVRCEPCERLGFEQRPGRRDPRYPLWVARVLDLLERVGYRLGEAAEKMGTGTARLARDLASDPRLWQAVNEARTRQGLAQLRPP